MNPPTEVPLSDDNDEIARWVWHHLVPKSGQCDTMQGELLRSVEKLRWEAQNNGNINWDAGFEVIIKFLETTLCSEQGFTSEIKGSIQSDLALLRNYDYPYLEDDLFDRLTGHVAAFCRIHPLLIPRPKDPDLHR
jgi:hypothetical protein